MEQLNSNVLIGGLNVSPGCYSKRQIENIITYGSTVQFENLLALATLMVRYLLYDCWILIQIKAILITFLLINTFLASFNFILQNHEQNN